MRLTTTLWLYLIFLSIANHLPAQEAMRVIRSDAIDRNIPIWNIYIDDENNKWVSNEKGVFQVHSKDLATPAEASPDEHSILRYPGANFKLKLDSRELGAVLGSVIEGDYITTTYYADGEHEWWVGTANSGVFRLKTDPVLQLIERFDNRNSKLRSNKINTIYRDKARRFWVGTDEGALVGSGKKWDLVERYFRIQKITGYGSKVWVLSDNELWEVNPKDELYIVPMEPRVREGNIIDMEFGVDGRLWLASEIITAIDLKTGDYQIFGPAQEYTSQFATCIAVDSGGAAWVGTRDKGLYVIEKASAMTVTCLVDHPISCEGSGRDAALKVHISGGEPPYTYAWNAALQGDQPQNVGPGAYQVTVTDSRGKQQVAEAAVVDPRLKLSIAQEQEASADSGGDAVATVSVEGGSSNLTFLWDNGETTQTASQLTKGTHSVTVTDENGCTATAGIDITEDILPLTVSIEQTAAVPCAGAAEAALAVQVSGGKGPFNFQWSDASISGPTPEGLAAGTYQVTVTDAAENESIAEVEVTAPEALTASVTPVAPASTGQSDGQATVTASGGAAPYAFAWDNGETSETAESLAAGRRTVTVTDANDCTATATVDITEDILPLTVSVEQTAAVPCVGAAEAALAVQVSGGKGPFTFQWSDPSLSGPTPEGLAAGTYQVTVTDAAENESIAEVEVAAPEALTAAVTPVAPASTGQSDGQATVTASGGAAPYAFAWDNGETGETAEGLAPGRRTVTVTDANGCTATATVDITEDILPLTVSVEQTAAVPCVGAAEAALAVQVSGGKGPFTFQWSDASLSGPTPEGLAAGTYQVTVTDAAENESIAEVEVAAPEALTAAVTPVAPASTGQSDGQATVTASGGAAPYAFAWDNGETGETAEGLAPGRRTVTVTDANGCTATATVDITEDILPLTVSVEQTAAVPCAGAAEAALAVQVSGGKGPFNFQWSDASITGQTPEGLAAGTYQVTVTDAAENESIAEVVVTAPEALTASVTPVAPASTGQSDGQATVTASGGAAPYAFAWDNGETSETAEGLAPGRRTVTVTDANGCTATATVDITEDILPLTVSVEQTAAVPCAGAAEAALAVQVSGGKGPFNFQWSDASITGQTPEGLAAGTYQVTVTDAAENESIAEVVVTAPEALTASVTPVAPASTGQSDGQATVTASGGAAPYAFAWDNGETSETAEGLAPGRRTVTVTDANDCTATATVDITEDILPLTVSVEQTAAIPCAGAAEAALSVKVSGGKGPFNFQWSDASISGPTPEGLAAGTYQVTVTDAAENESIAEVEVTAPEALTASVTPVAPASTGQSDGQATVTASGGAAPYAFAWDNGETGETAEGLAPGRRTVTVTDANGCTAEAGIEITENILPLAVSVEQTAAIPCAGAAEAALAVQVSGGKGPFTFQWSDASLSGPTPEGLAAGTYQVTVTDAVENESVAEVVIAAPEVLTASLGSVSPANTDQSDGQATVQAAGGTEPYSYAWDNGETGETAEGLAPGRHTVTVTDANGCTATAGVDITEDIKPLVVRIEQTASIQCAGETTAALQVRVEGGKGPFEFKWGDDSLSGEQAEGLAPGDYELTVTDASGQSQPASFTIEAPAPLAVEVAGKKSATTDRSEDGQATLAVQGGSGGYTYAWDNGETGAVAQTLAVGDHSVTVTDANGCTATASLEITEKIIKELARGSVRSGQTINIQRLQFEADSSNIQPSSMPVLDEIYEFLDENPSIVVEVGGHTNSLPPPEFCDSLSTARARAVAEYLVQKGIDPERVTYVGYGKRRPIFSNQTEDGRRRNQRVEIKILRL